MIAEEIPPKIQNKTVIFRHLGLVDYQNAWQEQEELFAGVIATKVENRSLPTDLQLATKNYILFCQHPHVYTLGKTGKPEHLLLKSEQLAEQHIQFFHSNRGGDITYHGQGQLVAYPILDLDNFFTDIHLYLRMLEEAVIHTLADFGIQAGRISGLTGVWLDHEKQENPRKICAMGVRASRWVTMHGLALNINTDLTYFDHIVPCGITGKAVTSMAKELGSKQDMALVEEKLLSHLTSLFKMDLEKTA
ncbi:MAG: lipoyl(octanoyl) transferase LipB [Verrucomicrobia bacterium]|nr:lipoyl(octanoyl) transferase LipB [Cytophagales bacterium]